MNGAKAQSLNGVFQTASSIEARTKLEPDLVAGDALGNLGDFFESKQARALGLIEPFQPGADEDSVLADQGDEIGDGAEGDEIEVEAEVEVFCAGQAGFASAK